MWSFTHILASNNNTCGIVSKMNEHRLFILINTSYMILLVILLAKLSRLFYNLVKLGIIGFPLRSVWFYRGTLHDSIFLYLYQAFIWIFFLASRFSAKSVGSALLQVSKIAFHTAFEQVFVAYVSTHLPTYLLLTYQLICFFAHIH